MAFPIAIGMVAAQEINNLIFNTDYGSCLYFIFRNLSKYYIGSCLDLAERLEQHRNKVFQKCFTAKDSGWSLFFEIPDLEYRQAREIERHIKKMKSSTYICNLTKYKNIVENLKEKYS